VVFFDGASNVQKAGRLLAAKFPRLWVHHGAEHVASLFFSDISKLWQLQLLIVNYRRLYRVFGSGAMHSPYALYCNQSKVFNGGRKVGLLRCTEVRMGTHFYAWHRMLRCKAPLDATVSSAAYRDLKLNKGVPKKVEAFLKLKPMWDATFNLLRCVFPVLRVLRLADKASCGGMSKLHYYVRMTDKAIAASMTTLDDLEYFRNHVPADADDDDDGLEDGFSDDDSTVPPPPIDDDSDDGDSDDDSDDSDERTLGENIEMYWKKRRQRLITPLSLAGWFCSPIPEIREDCKNNETGLNRLEVEEVIKKLYYPMTDEEVGKIIETFWREFNDFEMKQGPGYSRPWIWKTDEIKKGQCHLWHKLYSIPFTEVFGAVACRVCSKILGIGSAERSWGAVKHLKSGKRSHMSSAKTRMQATVFGAASIDRARSEAAAAEQNGLMQEAVWTDADLAFDLGLENWNGGPGIPEAVVPRRLFNAWIEDWEYESMKKKDVVHEAKLLKKYGGMHWMDPDVDEMCVADAEKMEYQGGRNGAGWCLVGVQESDGAREPWVLSIVIDEIAECVQPPLLNVEVIVNESLRAANILREEEEKAQKRAAKRSKKT
jgi:hypothetical protein